MEIHWDILLNMIGWIAYIGAAVWIYVMFKRHNAELEQHGRKEREAYYQYVKENWFRIDNGGDR